MSYTKQRFARHYTTDNESQWFLREKSKISKPVIKKITKCSQEEQICYIQGNKNKNDSRFLIRKKQKEEENEVIFLKYQWGKKMPTENSIPSKNIFQNKRIKAFSVIQKLKEFSTNWPALQDMFNDILQEEEKW